MTDELATALGLVIEAACAAQEPWWVIGSAAMALHGAAVDVGDIDLLMSRPDAARLLAGLGVEPAPGAADERFRSKVFGRVRLGGYTVEVFGGFHVRDDVGWREVVPESRVALTVGESIAFVPSVAELISMCRLFGRPKDTERVRLLQAPSKKG